jgi:hypothetical protein
MKNLFVAAVGPPPRKCKPNETRIRKQRQLNCSVREILASVVGLAVLCAACGGPVVADETVQIRGWNIKVTSPLRSLPRGYLFKANDKTPTFGFSQRAGSLSEACSQSISLQFNDFSSVTLRGTKSVDEFRALADGVRPVVTKEDVASLQSYLTNPDTVLAATEQLRAWSTAFPDTAKKMPPYTRFGVAGGSEAAVALCTLGDLNLARAAKAKITGGCTNVRNTDGLSLVYSFDPGLCRFDNTLVTTEILQHFSADKGPAGNGDSRLECSDRIPPFIAALDTSLDGNPRGVMPVFDVLDRFFPLKKCVDADVLASARKSRHFADSSERNGRSVFMFSSGPEGINVSFAVLPSGETDSVSAWPAKPSL